MTPHPEEAFEAVLAQYGPMLSKECAKADPGRRSGVDWGDLMQAAREALWRAQKNWDPDKGANFLTYATSAVRNAVRECVRKEANMGLASLPPRPVKRDVVARWEKVMGRPLSGTETAEVMDLAYEDRADELALSNPNTIQKGDEWREPTDAPTPGVEEGPFAWAVENVLHGRDQQMVMAWMCGYTYAEIGKWLGVSASRVGQLVPKAIGRAMDAAKRSPKSAVEAEPALPVDRSLAPPAREPEPPRLVTRDGDVIAHLLDCLNTKSALVVTKNKPGSTLAWNVTCSKALGGCGSGGDVYQDPRQSAKPVRASKRNVLPTHGLKLGQDTPPVERRPNSGPMERIWRG